MRSNHIFFRLILCLPLLALFACTGRTVTFADMEWTADRQNGRLVSDDGAYEFTFGTALVGPDVEMIKSGDDLARYGGAGRYLAAILRTAGMRHSRILAYVPERGTMWVELDSAFAGPRPRSVTVNLDEAQPYTLWAGDEEERDRTAEEMFTYTYCRKRQKLLILADVFDYGDDPVARITLLQTDTKRFRKTGLPASGAYPYCTVSMDCIEMISNWVDGHRLTSAADWKLGRFPAALPDSAQSNRAYSSLVSRADSCYAAGHFREAGGCFRQAFRHSRFIEGRHLYNAACAASRAGLTNTAFGYLHRRMAAEPEWYLDRPERDSDLTALHGDSRWADFVEEMSRRRTAIEKDYDHGLRAELQAIAAADQEIRYQYLNAVRSRAADSSLTDSLAALMRRTDSINLAKVERILSLRGWPSRKLVGDANQALWLVVQHSGLAAVRRWLPLFRKAAGEGELSAALVAMTDDRCAVWSGLPQKYGTQGRMEGGRFVLYKLLDAGKVDEWRKEAGLPPLDEYIRQMESSR